MEPPERADKLNMTLSYAVARIPFYSRYLENLSGAPNLSDFPIIDSTVVADAVHDFYYLDRFPDFVLTTGGTTAGNGVGRFYFFNYDEIDRAFRERFRLTPGEHLSPEAFDSVALLLTDQQHGIILPPGYGQPIIPIPLDTARHLMLVERFLHEGIVVSGRRHAITDIYGSVTKLRVLTAYLESRYPSGEIFEIRRILSMAFHLSSYWANRLRSYWGSTVTDSYGLTEFMGTLALPCADCDAFHLSETVYAEFLDDDLVTNVTEGPALLVLTSLAPYRHVMPLIRYNTRDLVEVLPSCPVVGGSGFRFAGRRDAALVATAARDRPTILLTSFDILDVLELPVVIDHIEYDETIATVMSWGIDPPVPDYRHCGYPRLNIRRTERGLAVTIEARESREPHSVLADFISGELVRLAQARAGGWGVEDQSVAVRCVTPGFLRAAGLPLTLV